ncbi:MFS transporter [Rhodanobacter lindaniclasticus]
MPAARRESLFANANFRLLFGGSTISMLGDQFTLVALPWLVLKLTGNPAALGLVLAAMALPRALFMLIGGAVVDRLSPRRVPLAARGRLGLMVLTIDSLAGLALAALALVHATATGAVLLATTGVFAGIAQIAIVSWIQRRVAPEMMGRAMSVLMFTFMGLGPISAAIAGSLLQVTSLTDLFAGAGPLLTAIALACMRSPALRSIGAPRPTATPAA